MTNDSERRTDRLVIPTTRGRRWPSALAGTIACALGILALGMIGAQIVASLHNQPGPGPLALAVHVAAAIAGFVGYRLAIRRPGATRVAVCAALLVMAGLLLWFYWLAA